MTSPILSRSPQPPALMLMLQAAAPLVANPIDFDLKTYAPSDRCQAATSDEIVVCALKRRQPGPRLPALPPGDFEDKPLVAAKDFGGGVSGQVHADAKQLLGGAVSNRMMTTIKKAF